MSAVNIGNVEVHYGNFMFNFHDVEVEIYPSPDNDGGYNETKIYRFDTFDLYMKEHQQYNLLMEDIESKNATDEVIEMLRYEIEDAYLEN